MNDAELAQKINQQLRACAGFDGDQVSKDRKAALDYYFQRLRGDEVVGRSRVVSGDVSAMVDANLAQILTAFSSDAIAEFDAFGADDEDQAQLESDTVQYFVMSRCNGFLELTQSVKDALLLRNGVMKVWVEERTDKSRKRLKNVAPDALGEITRPDRAGTTVNVTKYDPDTGQANISITKVRRRFRCEAVDLANFLYPANFDSLDLQECPFIGERHLDNRSDLVELFPKSKADIANLPAIRVDTNLASSARNPRRLGDGPRRGIDPSQDMIEWFECYAMMDSGNGTAERHRVAISGTVILEDEAGVSMVPYAAGTAIINPHRFLGQSLYDKLKQVQDLNTGLTRALMDNVNTTTKNRMAYLDGKVNVDDVSDGRPNGALRVKSTVADVRAAVMPFPIPDTSANILANIQHQRSVRTEMGGAALELATGQMELNDRLGSQGLDRAYSVMESLAAMMARTAAASLIRSVYLLAHATLREYYTEPVPVKREGRWATPIPSKWQPRECVTVKVGMSPGERARKSATLQTLLDAQIKLAGMGMDDVLVNLDGFYATLMDWARVNDIQNPEQYFVDPRSDSSKKNAAMKQQSAQRQQQLQENLMRQAVQLEQLRTAFDKYKQDTDLQFQYWNATLQAEVDEAKIVGTATTELIKQEGQGDARANGKDGQGSEVPTRQ